MHKYLILLLLLSFEASAADSQSELHSMLKVLNEHTKILKEWSMRNQEQNNALIELSDKSSQREDLNYKITSKETWDKIKSLNQNSRLLLEACADTVDEYVSIGNYMKAYERSKAWDVCRDPGSCSFYSVTSSYNQETLELAERTQEKGQILGQSNIEILSAQADEEFLQTYSISSDHLSLNMDANVN